MTSTRVIVGTLLRSAVLLGAMAVFVAVLDQIETSDPLSGGLVAFLVLATGAFWWALADGIRSGFGWSLLVWMLTALVAGIAIPVGFAVAESNGLLDELRDGAVFFGLLVGVPAAVGVGIGGLINRAGS